MKRVCLSVLRQISKTNRREISSPLQEIGVAEQEYDVIDFAPEVAKYPKSSPKPQNSGRLQAHCFAPLATQLVVVAAVVVAV